jgi:GGDEF domain-containing protein
VFLEVIADVNRNADVDLMKSELSRRGVKGFRLNYVVYRKMTADDQVVQKDMVISPPGTPVAGMQPGITGGAQPSDSVSLTRMLIDPKATAGSLFYASRQGAPPKPATVASTVAMLGSQVRQAATTGQVASENLMEAVLVLREECFGHIKDFNTAGLIDQEMEQVVGEVEKLTHETILHLVREEYRSGEVSVKRIAQILRRMLPDRRELRRLLPLLKDALLGAGMPYVKYVELIGELRHELEGDDVVAAVAQAAREMGVTPDEVIEEIKKHPADAARLMILSAELRHTDGANDAGFEQLLTDYIEKVSQQMTVSSTDAKNPEGGKQLGAVLQKIEANLIDNLKKQGVAQSVLTALTARLTERLPYLLDMTKTEWLKSALDAQPDLDVATLAKLIAGTVQQAVDIDTHRDTLYALCQKKGLTPDQIQEVLHQAATRVAAMAAQIDLPRGVLSSSAIMYFLDRECKLSLRYHNPFSLLVLSILRVNDGAGGERPLSNDERPTFTRTLIIALKGIMRDIDMIGVPSSTTESIVFVILPMTEEANTYGLVQRLRRELSEHSFEVAGALVRLNLAVSITGFDYKSIKDKTEFLKAAMAHHRAAEKIQLAGMSGQT